MEEKTYHETTLFSSCERPVRVQNKYFPCGQCPLCRRRRMLEWKVRGTHELMSHNNKAIFITLTYKPKHLPKEGEEGFRIIKRTPKDAGGNLRPEDMTLFLKRFRKYISKKLDNRKIKYIYCGEYGTLRWRPHYHAIIYNIDSSEITEKELQKIWGLGKVDLSTKPISERAIQYTIGYTSKKLLDRYSLNMEYIRKGRKPPFLRQSQGIGKKWALSNKDKVASLKINMFGFEQPIPRAYIKFIKKQEGIVIRTVAEKYEIKKEKTPWEERVFIGTEYRYTIFENPEGKYSRMIRKNQIKMLKEKLAEAEDYIDNPEYFENIQEIEKKISIKMEEEEAMVEKWQLLQTFKKNGILNQLIPKATVYIKGKKLYTEEELEEWKKKTQKIENVTAHSNEYIEEERKRASFKIGEMMKGLYGKRQKMEEMQDILKEAI